MSATGKRLTPKAPIEGSVDSTACSSTFDCFIWVNNFWWLSGFEFLVAKIQVSSLCNALCLTVGKKDLKFARPLTSSAITRSGFLTWGWTNSGVTSARGMITWACFSESGSGMEHIFEMVPWVCLYCNTLSSQRERSRSIVLGPLLLLGSRIRPRYCSTSARTCFRLRFETKLQI